MGKTVFQGFGAMDIDGKVAGEPAQLGKFPRVPGSEKDSLAVQDGAGWVSNTASC